jgi:diacylglycerol kinase family enzyme
VAAGGDGTVNEVVRGVVRATALDRVTVGIVLGGTGNDFAGNVGITGIEQAFEVLDRGERRRVDFGVDDDRPFRNSCCGLTAEASAETDPGQKERFGTVAYVLNTLRTLSEFD